MEILIDDKILVITDQDRTTIKRYLTILGHELDAGEDDSFEDLVGAFFSLIPVDDRDFGKMLEISFAYFISYETVNTLINSNDGIFDINISQQLSEISVIPHLEVVCATLDARKILFLMNGSVREDSIVSLPSGLFNNMTYQVSECTFFEPWSRKWKKNHCTIYDLKFGFYKFYTSITISTENTSRNVSGSFLCSSAVYYYTYWLDESLDRLYWGWEGNWTAELESALLELLVSVGDDLVALVRSWKSLMAFASGGHGEDLEQMLEVVRSDVQNALCEHSMLAVGRLHQTLTQFTEMGSGLGGFANIPQEFQTAIHSFVLAKLQASPAEPLINTLLELESAASEYRRVLLTKGTPHSATSKLSSFISSMSSLRQSHQQHNSSTNNTANESSSLQSISASELGALQNLKPHPMEMMASFSAANLEQWDNNSVAFMPTIPFEYIHNSHFLDTFAWQLSQTLVMETINVGHPMMGFTIDIGNSSTNSNHYSSSSSGSNVTLAATIISCLLQAGFTYVTTESGKLMASLSSLRSMLPLVTLQSADPQGSGGMLTTEAPLPSATCKRLKDMPRIFRNKIKKQLSFRINSCNLSLAVQKLRGHHGSGECWVGERLEAVWECMRTHRQLVVFELWYGEELVAADFAHPIHGGKVYYVATRFSERSETVRQLQPGFMLALLEIKYLRDRGCVIWDLGGYNLCPLMRYKLELTGTPYSRPAALTELLIARGCGVVNADNSSSLHQNGGVEDGIVYENVTYQNLC